MVVAWRAGPTTGALQWRGGGGCTSWCYHSRQQQLQQQAALSRAGRTRRPTTSLAVGVDRHITGPMNGGAKPTQEETAAAAAPRRAAPRRRRAINNEAFTRRSAAGGWSARHVLQLASLLLILVRAPSPVALPPLGFHYTRQKRGRTAFLPSSAALDKHTLLRLDRNWEQFPC